MPLDSRGGQMITFAIEHDEDLALAKKWVRVQVRVGDTVRKIAARRGHPEHAKAILKRNKIRSGRTVLRHKPKLKKDRTSILVPGKGPSLSVLAGDQPPRPISGYAKFETVDRPERVGLTRFQGYDPFTLEVPIRFEAWTAQGGRVQGSEGEEIERDIKLLERMAGRGDFKGGNVGPPPVIRISSTNNQGAIVPLISDQFQWTPKSPAPLWRVANIDWDPDALRSRSGNRLRQLATVTLQENSRVQLATRSAADRNKRKRKKKKDDPKGKARPKPRSRS